MNTTASSDHAGDDGARVLRLLDFLAAYDARKSPPVRSIGDYGIYLLREPALLTSVSIRVAAAEDAWLVVDFVDLPTAPKIPEELADAFERPSTVSSRLPPVLLADAPADLTGEAQRWIKFHWAPWAIRHREALGVKAIYRDLFEARQRLESDRESVELVWGFGRFRWQPSDVLQIDHPLVTMTVEVDLNAETQQISVRPVGVLEIESIFLAGIQLADRVSFNASRQEAEVSEVAIDPWDALAMEPLLRRLVRSIDQNGVFGTNPTTDRASAQHEWALYLRRRRPDYQGFLDRMRELYQSGATIPDPIRALVTDKPSVLGMVQNGERSSAVNGPLLLPLPTNEEQQRILMLAQHRSGVTVQGPPGTGKSHTIANIGSHYVAYGQRVLVVAEKEQALRVSGLPTALRQVKEAGIWIVGLDDGGERTLFEMGHLATDGICIVLGAEGAGLSKLVTERCDMIVGIPMLGRLSSLNVSAATAWRATRSPAIALQQGTGPAEVPLAT